MVDIENSFQKNFYKTVARATVANATILSRKPNDVNRMKKNMEKTTKTVAFFCNNIAFFTKL